MLRYMYIACLVKIVSASERRVRVHQGYKKHLTGVRDTHNVQKEVLTHFTSLKFLK
jgi:hypothetical protein